MKNSVGFNGDMIVTLRENHLVIQKSRGTHLYVTVIRIGQCYSVFAIIKNVFTYVCVYVHDDISKYY